MRRAFAAAGLAWFAALGQAAGPAPGAAPDTRRSGCDFMIPQTQALQRDDTQNPGMLWVAEGEELWGRRFGVSNRSCADCHGSAATSMRGVAARYPAYDTLERRAVDLGARIQLCRERNQWALALAAEGNDLLSLHSYVAYQSRGMAITPDPDARLAPLRERGQALYFRRQGQLDFSCAQCHDDNAGQRLGGSVIPQAHPTGYPQYRLEWQGLGSLQRRLRSCMTGVRAEPYAYGSAEWVALELYLVSRAAGMPIETPAVRP